MNTSNKIAWHAAAVAAATLVSAGAVHAHDRDYGRDHGYDFRGDEHHRVWRDHDRHRYYYDRFDRFERHFDHWPYRHRYDYFQSCPPRY